MSDEQNKLPPQQSLQRPEAKPQHKPLRSSRRVYEVREPKAEDPVQYMGDTKVVDVFWLNPDNSRDAITPWWEPRPVEDLVQYLRSKGYCTLSEAADRS